MKHLSVFKVMLLFAAIVAVTYSTAQSTVQAKLITFMISGATDTYVTCVNDSNDIAGYFYNGTEERGFIYFANAADTVIVNYPSATNTRIYGINNNRIVVGSYNTTGNIADNKGFKYNHATLTFNETTTWLAQTYKVSRDINDAGCIVGDHRTSPSTSVCHISCGGSDIIFHYNYNSSFINGINNSNRAVGFWLDAPQNYGFIREADGSLTDLNYPGATRTRLMGINDSNMVVGTFDLSRSFVYKGGVFKEIVKSGTSDIQVQDINNYGFIVGFYKNASNHTVGFYMPFCDIGFRPNPNGWHFNNSSTNLWPHSYYSQIDYNTDPYRYGQAPFPKIYANNQWNVVQNFLFPDWKLFVETFGEQSCYTVVNNIPVIKNSVFNKWYNMTDNWGGSCFGFTMSSFMAWNDMPLFKSNYPNVDPWNIYTEIYQIPINYHSRRCINQLQLKQSQKVYFRYYNQNGNLSPNEALKKIKIRLLDSNKDEGGLVFFNQNGGGGHIVCPYKVEIDTLDPNIEYIYVYDNNQPNDTTRRVKINKVLNSWYYNLSGNAAIAQSEWGGDNAHKGMYMFLPSSTLYAPSYVDSLKKTGLSEDDKNLTFDIYNSTNSNTTINDLSGNTTSFVNNVLTNNIPGAEPMFGFAGNQPPYGYMLPESTYFVEMENFSDSLADFSLITELNSYFYSRSQALLSHHDKFQIDANGVKYINTDNVSKSINVQAIANDAGNEKTFGVLNLPLNSNSNITFNILTNDKLKVKNEGIATAYDLRIQYISSSVTGLFEHASIVMDANTTHTIVMNWNNIQNADVCIYIDNGNNGINDDTLCFSNQGVSEIITNPTIVQLSSSAQTDTLYIGNSGAGIMNWSVTSDSPTWLSITGSNSGSNFGYIKYTVNANSGTLRTGHLTLTAAGASNSPYVIEVNQAGVLAVPANLTASDGTFSDGVHVSWDALAGATHYKLYRSTVAGSNGTAITGWITPTTYIDNTVNGGDFYYYSVKAAQNSSGLNESGFSNIDDGWKTCFTANFNHSGVCLGQPTIFENMSSVHTNAYFLWDIDNNGTTDYVGENISHTYTSTGSKTIVLTVTDSSLCNSTFQKTITILSFPTVNLPEDTIACAGQFLTLNAGSGFSSYLWSTGSTSNSITIDSTGFGLGCSPVYVSVTNANGCSTIDTTAVTWTVCSQLPEQGYHDFNWNIYPNPANSELNIVLEGELSNVQLMIYNFNGQLVYSDKVEEVSGSYTHRIELRDLPAGIYLFRCLTDDAVKVKKLIVY
ncbi:MAG: T9SS type A sorting domain-containing protein [Bacteroidales bacterium]|nr:T9SS type A sorting domain-containing protein [Bacteroidales bacterium]